MFKPTIKSVERTYGNVSLDNAVIYNSTTVTYSDPSQVYGVGLHSYPIISSLNSIDTFKPVLYSIK